MNGLCENYAKSLPGGGAVTYDPKHLSLLNSFKLFLNNPQELNSATTLLKAVFAHINKLNDEKTLPKDLKHYLAAITHALAKSFNITITRGNCVCLEIIILQYAMQLNDPSVILNDPSVILDQIHNLQYDKPEYKVLDPSLNSPLTNIYNGLVKYFNNVNSASPQKSKELPFAQTILNGEYGAEYQNLSQLIARKQKKCSSLFKTQDNAHQHNFQDGKTNPFNIVGSTFNKYIFRNHSNFKNLSETIGSERNKLNDGICELVSSLYVLQADGNKQCIINFLLVDSAHDQNLRSNHYDDLTALLLPDSDSKDFEYYLQQLNRRSLKLIFNIDKVQTEYEIKPIICTDGARAFIHWQFAPQDVVKTSDLIFHFPGNIGTALGAMNTGYMAGIANDIFNGRKKTYVFMEPPNKGFNGILNQDLDYNKVNSVDKVAVPYSLALKYYQQKIESEFTLTVFSVSLGSMALFPWIYKIANENKNLKINCIAESAAVGVKYVINGHLKKYGKLSNIIGVYPIVNLVCWVFSYFSKQFLKDILLFDKVINHSKVSLLVLQNKKDEVINKEFGVKNNVNKECLTKLKITDDLSSLGLENLTIRSYKESRIRFIGFQNAISFEDNHHSFFNSQKVGELTKKSQDPNYKNLDLMQIALSKLKSKINQLQRNIKEKFENESKAQFKNKLIQESKAQFKSELIQEFKQISQSNFVNNTEDIYNEIFHSHNTLEQMLHIINSYLYNIGALKRVKWFETITEHKKNQA